jgi:hypothetical protein
VANHCEYVGDMGVPRTIDGTSRAAPRASVGSVPTERPASGCPA